MRGPRKPSSVRMVRTLLCCCCVAGAIVAAVVMLLPLLRQQSAPAPVTAAATGAAGSAALGAAAAAAAASKSGAAAKTAVAVPAKPRIDIDKVARALDPEIMEHALPVSNLLPAADPASSGSRQSAALLQGYRTPCWRVAGSDHTRCLPYVYLAGSFQAGQDSLYEKLAAHPDIAQNEMTRWQFWGEEGKRMAEYTEKHGRSLPELAKNPGKKVLLDGSASTFAFYWSAGLRTHQAFQKVVRPCWANCSEHSKGKKPLLHQCMEEVCYPMAMAADKKVASDLGVTYDDLHLPVLMAAAYGGQHTTAHLPKMIVLVRNPIDRLHSAYWHYAHYKGKYGETAEGFLAYVKEQVGAFRKCEARGLSARECALYFEALGADEEAVFFHVDQFIRGMYSLFLEIWLRHLPRSNVLILKAEDYFSDAMGTLKQVYSFLGLEHPADERDAKKVENAGRRGRAAEKGQPAMLPEAEQLLKELYAPWNKQLAQLLGDDSYLAWGV